MDTDEVNVPMATPNMALVFKVLDKIAENEDKWSQYHWVDTDGFLPEDEICGTTKCFGGWAVGLSNRIQVDETEIVFPVDVDGKKSTWFGEACRLLGFNPYLGELVFFTMEHDLNYFKNLVLDYIVEFGYLTRDEVQEKLKDRIVDRGFLSNGYGLHGSMLDIFPE